MALIEKLSNIGNAIREKTGKEDLLSLDDMAAEIRGIAAGGGASNGFVYDMGEFVLDADVQYLDTKAGIPHRLGESPEFVLVWTDDFADLSADNLATREVNMGYIILLGLFGLPQRLSSAATNMFALHSNYYITANDYRTTIQAPSSAAYSLQNGTLPSSTAIPLFKLGSNGYFWRAGVRYKYFVSKAWWGGIAE